MSIHSIHYDVADQSLSPSINSTKDKTSSTRKSFFIQKEAHTLQKRINAKKDQARKQAKQLIMDQFKQELAIDKNFEEMELKAQNLNEVAQEHEGIASDLYDKKLALKDQYGITDDSQEQKDLLLMEKANNGEPLTKEELERFNSLKGVTAYQAECLQYDEQIAMHHANARSAHETASSYHAAIIHGKVERAKDQSMRLASDAADNVLNQATDDIKQMAVDEAIHIIKKQQEENTKKQEKIKETAASQTEKEENAPHNINDLIDKFSKRISDLQKKLQKLQKDNHLLSSDMTGLVVDQTV